MTPRVGGSVMTPEGLGEYRGPTQPHGMALVVFRDGHFAYYDTRHIYAVAVRGVVKARDLVDARVARMLAAQASAKEGDR